MVVGIGVRIVWFSLRIISVYGFRFGFIFCYVFHVLLQGLTASLSCGGISCTPYNEAIFARFGRVGFAEKDQARPYVSHVTVLSFRWHFEVV